MPVYLFAFLAFISIISAVAMVANKNPVRSALALVVNFFVLAVFYVTLSAQFVAAVQVIVYAGAIMVLFLFVIMLLNLGVLVKTQERPSGQSALALCAAVVLFSSLSAAGALTAGLAPMKATKESLAIGGTVEVIGKALYDPNKPWLFPFELTSLLLLMAVVGAIVLAKRKA